MESRTQHIATERCTEAQHLVNGGGTVLPPPVSHGMNCVGIHWLRISLPKKNLSKAFGLCSTLWGESDHDGRGLWSYDSRFCWSNGVSLNFDADKERSFSVHNNCATLDVPGSACDELTSCDLTLIIDVFKDLGGKCTRIDTYYDDYDRRITPHEVYDIVKKRDYSGFRTYSRIERGNLDCLTHDEIAFGRRGSFGNGKYLRFYDKGLESNGKQDCCRWEVEWTGEKADRVFQTLSATRGDLEVFGTIIGSLVAGCITFVRRTGDKNISRLETYSWWQEILDILGGKLVIRTSRKKDSLTGKIEWIKRSVAPSMACLKKVFVDKDAFYRWLWDVCSDGDGRMNAATRQIAKENEASMDYRWGEQQLKGVFEHVMS